jgi:hypothetical protein
MFRGSRQNDPDAVTAPSHLTADPQLHRIISDPRGPDAVTSSLSNEELAQVLDALYRSLDTPAPEPGTVYWYEACLEESLRRHGRERTRSDEESSRT